MDGGIGNHLLLLPCVVNVNRPDPFLVDIAVPFDVAVHYVDIVAQGAEAAVNGPETFCSSGPEGTDADFPGFQDVFVRRFAQVQVIIVDEILGHGVDEVGNIPVEVDIFPDTGRADIFVEFIQQQRDDLARNGIAAGSFLVLRFPRFSGKGNVVHCMYGISCRHSFIGRGVFDDVGPDGDIQLFSRKDFLQASHVGLVGNIDRHVVREGVNVLFIGHGHIHDLAAHEPRLGMFGPGKFIEGQIDIESQVADPAGHGLVAQTEGVEGAGIKAGLMMARELEGAAEELVTADIAVDVVQHGGIAVEIQCPFAVFKERDQQFLVGMGKEEIRLFLRHAGAVEDEAADITESITAPFLIVMGIGLDHDIQEMALPFFVLFLIIGKGRHEFPEMFQNDADGADHGRRHLGAGRQYLLVQGDDEFIQFLRRQFQDHAAQIFRHVLGNLQVSDLKAVEEFHRHFVALGIGHAAGDRHERLTGSLADKEGFAHFEQVGQMHAQVHDRAAVTAVVEIMDHEVDIGHFDDPVGAHLEVIEIEAPLFLIKRLPLGRQTFDGQQVLPEFFVRTQPEAVTAVERRNLKVRIFRSGRCRNKRAGGLEECIVHIGRPHIAQGFQEDNVQLGHVVRPFIVRTQDIHIGRPVRDIAVL